MTLHGWAVTSTSFSDSFTSLTMYIERKIKIKIKIKVIIVRSNYN